MKNKGHKMQNDKWALQVKGLLKAELKKQNISYDELSAKLAKIGIKESAQNLNNKINRAKFSAVFLLQCLKAINVNKVEL